MYDPTRPGPFYEDFVAGATLPPLPAITLTSADNVLYRAMTGDQHALAASEPLYRSVAGSDGALANPGMVMQYSIGQTTMATRQAIANLYYRSVRVLRPVEVGSTLSTVTTVLGLADSSSKGGTVRGKVWLGITTSDDHGPVVEYERCALIRGRGTEAPGHSTEIPGPSDPMPLADLAGAVPHWDLTPLPATAWEVGEVLVDPLREHVDLAAPLARWTFNQAAVHRDPTLTVDGRRLVYGGHVQGLGQASLTRMLPGVATVVGWDGCDHVAPAHEGDLFEFSHTLVEATPAGSGRLMRFRVIGSILADDGSMTEALRWTPIVWAR